MSNKPAITMNANKQALKLPGASKVRGKPDPEGPVVSNSSGTAVNILHQKDLEALLKRGSSFLDLSSPSYMLESDEFLLYCPNVLKEIDLSDNALIQLSSAKALNKLKRLFADNNHLVSASFHGLVNLVQLSLVGNRLVTLEDMSDLKKLVHLDLMANRISSSFDELAKLKALKVLDLSSNSLDLPIQNFSAFLLEPLKRLPKLEYLSFLDNAIESSIPEFRCFIAHELPRLKYLDWLPITKEERTKATKLDSEGLWANKSLPIKDSPSPRAAVPDLSVRHSVSYNKDTLDFVKSIAINNGNSGVVGASGMAPDKDSQTPPTGVSQRVSVSVSTATPSPSHTRRVPPSRAPSEQFNGDFSALDAMIEEFEGASQELMLSRSSSSTAAPATPTSNNQTHFTSFDIDISNISNISSPPPVAKTSSQDALTELLNEFETIAPSPSRERVGQSNNTRNSDSSNSVSPTPTQFNEALARTTSNSSYEKYPEDAQILSNIDKVIDSTGSMAKPRSKKFATNVVRSDFPDAFFADELEAALSELEASLDFPELDVDAAESTSNTTSHTRNSSDFNLSNLSEIESTLQELANTTSTPSKSDTSDTNYKSPYSTPTHNNSHLSPYTNYQSNSIRLNTPLHKPAAPTRSTPDSNPVSPSYAKSLPRTTTPPSGLKKAATPPQPFSPISPTSHSHSFSSSFDPSSATTSPAPSILPESPKIRSRQLSQIFTPPREETVEIPEVSIVEEPKEDEDVLDKLISSLALDTPIASVHEEPQMPTMLRARRPLSAVFVPPVSHPALSTLPPAQLPPSIIKSQEHQLQQQLHMQQVQKQQHLQQLQEQEQQQLVLQRQLHQHQQQLEQLQQQQKERENQLIAERERERLQREQIAQREKLLQKELQQQREQQIQKELLLQTELRQKEMQAEALLQQQKQNALLLQQQALQQQQQQTELASRKLQQQEEEQRLINLTAQIIPYNHLTINTKIGGGSFGDVHAAVMRYAPNVKLPPKDITIKKIRMQRFNDNFLDQFKQEVQSFSALPVHPNVLPLVGGCVEVVICTIHEYADGISLADTKGLGELGSNLTLQIARSIVSGLQALHSIGKMHRSLKPSNVILANPTPTNPLRTVRLRDYGFTTIKDSIIKAGQAPGPYVAPEIVSSPSPTYTDAVDTFAFGMTLWFMLTGEQPFPGMHPKKMSEALAAGVRPPVPQSTPPALAKLIAACWNSDPNARPPLDTVARILSVGEAKLFAGYSPSLPPQIDSPQHVPQQVPQQPPQQAPQQPPQQPPQKPQQPPQKPPQQPPQPSQNPQAIPGSRINTVLAKVVDTLVQRAANQIPKACKLLEVINQPEVIPVMIEKGIPSYLVDMLKNTQIDSTDIEAVLRTLQILSSNETFAQTLCSSDMLTPILNLVIPHTAVANVSRSSYVVRNQYLQPAAKVIYAIVSHPSLLVVLRDRVEMETLIAFTDSLKDSQNHIANQSNDDATFQILGVLNQLLTTAKARNYFLNTSGLDAALFHVNSVYPPLRLQVADLLFLLTTNPTHTSPPTLLQDAFARNPASIIHLVSCIGNSADTLQTRSHASQAIRALAQMTWPGATLTPDSGSSRSNLRVNFTGVIASLQAAVPRLISAMASCKPGSDSEGLLVNICDAVTAILANPEINATNAISKLDQLAVFAQLQHLNQSSPSLQPVLQLAHHIVKVRDDTANLQGELGMVMPQLIQIACTSSNQDAQLLALDFIGHIASDAQHAAMMVDTGIVRPLILLLEQPAHTKPQVASLALRVLATILASSSTDPETFPVVCTSILSCGGVPVVTKYVLAGAGGELVHSCEWAVAVFYELSTNATGRTSIITEKVMPMIVGAGMHSEASERTIEGVLGVISQFCSPQYHAILQESNAIRVVATQLQSPHESIISLALKSVVQLAKDPASRGILVSNGVVQALQMLQGQAHNPTIGRAAAKICELLVKK